MRYIYVSKKGGKPMNIGMNQAKRIARRSDKQDRAKIVEVLGAGMPKNGIHHSELVRSRHRYYREQYEEGVREQERLDQENFLRLLQKAGDSGPAVTT